MAEDHELDEVAEKITEAKAAAEQEKQSRPFGADDEVTPPESAADEEASPS
jgi:hypothetical protein